jgi:hypothetical protein
MPIARFASYLKNNGQLEEYSQLLRESFNPTTCEGLMYRNTINTSWTGEVFDCDFNQMLKINHPHNETQKPLMDGTSIRTPTTKHRSSPETTASAVRQDTGHPVAGAWSDFKPRNTRNYLQAKPVFLTWFLEFKT